MKRTASLFLSPASKDSERVFGVYIEGSLSSGYAADFDGFALRPVLSLGSQAMIITGTGSINDPYELAA